MICYESGDAYIWRFSFNYLTSNIVKVVCISSNVRDVGFLKIGRKVVLLKTNFNGVPNLVTVSASFGASASSMVEIVVVVLRLISSIKFGEVG